MEQGKQMNQEMQSESIESLAEALSKAQGIIEGATKDSNNPFHRSKYADLHSVITCAKEALTTNGLSVSQLPTMIGDKFVIATMLMHKSGQWLKSITPIFTPTKTTTNKEKQITIEVKDDPQSIGSMITYMRRYAYCAILGISQYDEDAEEAMDRKKTEPKPELKAPEPTKGSELPVPEVQPTAPKRYELKDLKDRILAEKHIVPDIGALSAFIAQKAKEVGKALSSIIQSAMKTPESFEGFYAAFQRFSSATKDHEEEIPF